ncbi:hypothetical protein VTO7225_00232 [Vibrio toranzoniae]|nr:hypothetical protein VTO7225_00232 [Vibrio toranzoniae]
MENCEQSITNYGVRIREVWDISKNIILFAKISEKLFTIE